MGAVTKDWMNLLSHLNFRRIWNVFLIYFSYYLSRLIKKSIHFGKPISIAIEPTTTCNLRCSQCPSGLRSFSRPTGSLNIENFVMMLDQFSKELIYLTLYFQGEPFLNAHFFEMVSYAKSNQIYVATSTNAHFLNNENAKRTVESGLDRLIVSIDGADQSTYEAYRKGGNLEKVKEGIMNIVKWKTILKSNTPLIIGQFIVFSTNEHQLNDIKDLCRDLGIEKLDYKTAQVYDYEKGHALIPGNKSFSRYKMKKNEPEFKYSIHSDLPNHCFRMWSSCVITWDGLLVPCCFDKDANHQLGDLKVLAFDKIWHGSNYKTFRESILKDRKQNKICRNCTEGLKV